MGAPTNFSFLFYLLFHIKLISPDTEWEILWAANRVPVFSSFPRFTKKGEGPNCSFWVEVGPLPP